MAYIDWKVLACLFSLMAVVAGLRKSGLFSSLAAAITRVGGSVRSLSAILVFVTFFVSMAVTNDVALITFIPFSLILLRDFGNERLRLRIVTLQTIAANIGSSLTPVGNPQNLYLFSFYRMDGGTFFSAIAPIVLAGSALLALSLYAVPATPVRPGAGSGNTRPDRRSVALYAILFVLSVLAVFRILDYRATAAIVFAFVLVYDRSLFGKIDYSLLGTFVCFFVCIGNLQRIPSVNGFLTSVVSRNVVLVGALASQAISNVPAAILLSGFTENAPELLRAVSIGGMGTIIASLASVISFKIYTREYPGSALRYLAVFTFWNVLFLVALYGACLVL